ncbi:MAG: serine/threonine-protein phosphatase [Gemmatimonadetes bacterium]|nr:serine/threonine-protein phosphatase [Gemmatimonadota bacterium]
MTMSTMDLSRKPLDQEIDVFGTTDIGKIRSENQDQFLICALQKHVEVWGTSLTDEERLARLTSGDRMGFLALVADGVGGSAGGKEASQTAVESVLDYVTHSMQCFYTSDPRHEDDFLKSLHEAVMLSHEIVQQKAGSDTAGERMATTLTMYMGVWPRAYVVQVGDSRCYQLRDGNLQRVTKDQTLVQQLVDDGVVNQSQADRSRWRHILSSAIGGSTATPVTTKIDLQWGDVLLLCTDGLTRHVSEEEIEDRLNRMESAERVVYDLVSLALKRGGSDNITVVVGRIRAPAAS